MVGDWCLVFAGGQGIGRHEERDGKQITEHGDCVGWSYMENISPHLESELRRLANGPSSGEKPGGIGTVRFVIRCPIGTDEVLAKAKSVLKAVDDAILMGWPTNEKVAPKLPEWFTERCAAPITQEEAERQLAWWKSLPPEEQARI